MRWEARKGKGDGSKSKFLGALRLAKEMVDVVGLELRMDLNILGDFAKRLFKDNL